MRWRRRRDGLARPCRTGRAAPRNSRQQRCGAPCRPAPHARRRRPCRRLRAAGARRRRRGTFASASRRRGWSRPAWLRASSKTTGRNPVMITVALAHLLSLGVQLDADEALAVVLALAAGNGEPALENIELT